MENRPSRIPWTKFSFGSGHAYADNAELASKGLRFEILEIKFNTGWRLLKAMIVGSSRSRSPIEKPSSSVSVRIPDVIQQLRDAQAYLARGGKIENVRLRQSGKAYYFTESDS